MPTSADTFHEARTWESLLPSKVRQHIWLPVTNVTLTLDLPDGTSTTFQVRQCPALRLWADNVLLVQRERVTADSAS
jgi:hypothetical protein